ncbi:MAG: ATP-grasp domain-containing protein [Planctomycetaceae bacterium]
MKKLRTLVLMHESLVPPESLDGHSEQEVLEWKTEYDVLAALRKLGHEATPLGVSNDLGVIRDAIEESKPHIIFNLLEEFHGVAHYDQHVVSYLELMRLPYTGCNPRGLLLSHDKPLCKKILTYHRIPTPQFVVFPLGKKVKPRRRLTYPLLVKSPIEDASLGIAQASIVHSDEKLKDRVEFVHEHFQTDALAEEYIEGREFYVGVLGNRRLQTLPVWELLFSKMPDDVAKIATRRVKWDLAYQKKYGIATSAAEDLPAGMAEKIARLCKRIYQVLNLSGYARMDLRMTEDGRVYVLEANPNPNLSNGEDFADSAKKAGLSYGDLLQRILTLGLNYQAAWRL